MKKYAKTISTIIVLDIDVLLSNSVTSISTSDPLSNSTTTVINGGVIGSEVNLGTVTADSKVDLWSWE